MLPGCRHEYPQWRPQDLSRVFPSLEESGLELLRSMLQYDPARRISVSLLNFSRSGRTQPAANEVPHQLRAVQMTPCSLLSTLLCLCAACRPRRP
jgi:hypothetical protein